MQSASAEHAVWTSLWQADEPFVPWTQVSQVASGAVGFDALHSDAAQSEAQCDVWQRQSMSVP